MTSRSPDGGFPNGHFYSPVIDPVEVKASSARIWPFTPDVRGIDFNEAAQRQLLREVFPRSIADYDYPERYPTIRTTSDSSIAIRRLRGSTAEPYL